MALAGGNSGGGASAGGVRAGGAYVEIGTNNSALTRGLNAASARLRSWAGSAGKLGAAALGGGLAGGAVAGKLADGFVKSTVEVSRLAQKIGVSTEQLSRFAYAADTTGVTLQDLAGHWENLSERVGQAASGTGGGEGATAFKELGLDAKELIKLNMVDQLLAISDAMGKVGNRTKQNQLASALGSDQFQQLLPLFDQGAAGIRRLMNEADRLGLTTTTEQAKEATVAYRELQRTTAAAGSVLTQLGAALLPSAEFFQMVRASVVSTTASVRQWVTANRELVQTAGDVADGTAGLGAGILGVAGATFVAAAGVKTLTVATGLLLSPVGLLAAGVAGLTYAALQTQTGREALAGFGRHLTGTADTFSATWTGIKAALSSGDLALAGTIALAGLRVEWERGLKGITEASQDWGNDLLKNFRLVADGVRVVFQQAFQKIATGLQIAAIGAARLGVGGDTLRGMAAGLSAGSAGLPRAPLVQFGFGANGAGVSDAEKALRNAQTVARWKSIINAMPAGGPGGGPAAPGFVGGAGSTRGGFLGGADSALSVFGAGGVQQKQLDVQKKIEQGIKELPKGIADALPLRFT